MSTPTIRVATCLIADLYGIPPEEVTSDHLFSYGIGWMDTGSACLWWHPASPPDALRIPLTKGQYALIDTEDFDKVAGYSWGATQSSSRHPGYYAVTCLPKGSKPSKLYMHRLLTGAKPGEDVDHINGDGLDNRRSVNLRTCTRSQNLANSRRQAGKSLYKGVCLVAASGRWSAFIGGEADHRYLGTFDTETEAAEAYDLEARARYGEFARTNFPPSHTPSITALPVKRVVSAWTPEADETLLAIGSPTKAAAVLGRSPASCKRRKCRLKAANWRPGMTAATAPATSASGPYTLLWHDWPAPLPTLLTEGSDGE